MSARVRMADIAAVAGVSVPTVSRVLNGRGDVSASTRERVELVLREHGYRKGAPQRAGTARLLDVVFPDLDSPWAVELIRGVEEVAVAAGVGTVVSQLHGDPSPAGTWWRNLRERATDGVILVTSELDPAVQEDLHRRGVPLVVVDPAGTTVQDLPTVGATNWAGGMSATEHLLSLGHRRIGIVTGAPRILSSRARFDGYRVALENAGIAPDERLVAPGTFSHESGFEAARHLLALPDPPTAIFASSDQMAFGAYEAVRRLRLRVPDDVSIVGFDDLPQARWASPPLTTVRQPLSRMGTVAARTLLRLAAGEPVDSPRVELATELVVRESTSRRA